MQVTNIAQNTIKCFHIQFEINQFYFGDRICIFGHYLQSPLEKKQVICYLKSNASYQENKTNTVDNVMLLKPGKNLDDCPL